nr:MAG TPA: hypothetical protein [Caudoviricetes sp.]DAJ51834.1 MAG TPA: hypothetical protein [Caudoviricetes sp.]DAZ66499.1 MAG TPA: hypothetical protein [Caudoviricetes sp.]
MPAGLACCFDMYRLPRCVFSPSLVYCTYRLLPEPSTKERRL